MTDSHSFQTRPAAALTLYAAAHAAVDAACAVLLWRAVHEGLIAAGSAFSAFLIYNLLAFAVQPAFGLAVDRCERARGAAALGGLLTAAALPLATAPHLFVVAVLMAGLGNALFHVGGGVVSAGAAPGRATPLGFFVAPGAAGLALGVLSGRAGVPAWPFALALALLAAAILAAPRPVFRAAHAPQAPAQAPTSPLRPAAPVRPAARFELVLLLLLFVIAVRSYAGMALALPWKSHLDLLIALTAAVVLGKAAGGVLADRFGWRAIGVGALVVSLPLLALGGGSPAAGIAGMLVFNMTMPVTLVAVISVLPRHTGFAFGLTCLALFAGAAPVLTGWSPPLSVPSLLILSAAAALALWFGLSGIAPNSDRRRSAMRNVVVFPLSVVLLLVVCLAVAAPAFADMAPQPVPPYLTLPPTTAPMLPTVSPVHLPTTPPDPSGGDSRAVTLGVAGAVVLLVAGGSVVALRRIATTQGAVDEAPTGPPEEAPTGASSAAPTGASSAAPTGPAHEPPADESADPPSSPEEDS